MKTALRRVDTDRGTRRFRPPDEIRAGRPTGGVPRVRPPRATRSGEVEPAVIAWDVVLAGVAFALIGALLALRLAEAFSADDTGTGTDLNGETTGPAPPSDDGSRPGSVPDEDRVVELLSANDGRLRQQAIVDRTDWSKSKVSRLLSRMEDRGTIRKVAIGRENVIELAGQESKTRSVADGDDG